MTTKGRLSASLDPKLIEAAEAAVGSGRAPNVSAWIALAIQRQIEHERRLDALNEFVRAYEAEHGEITAAEIAQVTRDTRAVAIVVRPKRQAPKSRKKAL